MLHINLIVNELQYPHPRSANISGSLGQPPSGITGWDKLVSRPLVPFSFTLKSRVQTVYQPYCMVESCGSKILAFESEFLGEDQTDDLTQCTKLDKHRRL